MIIKIVLIAGAVTFGAVVLRERFPGQHQAVRRLFGIGIALVGVLAVAWPNSTTVVANAVGVTRGTDLVLYILVMVFLFNTVATYQRMHHLETRITDLTRALTLRDAAPPTAERKNV
ncbi:MAG: DUF2304 domain-containing protein [Marmoricola sp.]